ncbi:MAG: MBL fold metallo-hydrolase [Chloroflexi bacterium]|nr:MAG: MBL fold metallo-hydrolase [Chloroflexota bacterium]
MLSRNDVFVLHLADLLFPSWHPRAGETGPVNAFLIRHRDGDIIVDTGIGPAHQFIDKAYRPVRWPLPDVLSGVGARPASISAVINTHLHFDHCGGNSFFPGVPIFVQAAELEAATAADYTIQEFVHFAGARYKRVDGEADIAPGIRVVPTPHTPGHQSVIIETDGGRIVIAGQALETADEMDNGGDTAALLLSLAPACMLFSHDDRVWRKPGQRAV